MSFGSHSVIRAHHPTASVHRKEGQIGAESTSNFNAVPESPSSLRTHVGGSILKETMKTWAELAS